MAYTNNLTLLWFFSILGLIKGFVWKDRRLLTTSFMFATDYSRVYSQGKEGCKNLIYLPCVKNKTFRGHVIKTLKILAPGLQECQSKCFQEKSCISYNLGPQNGQITRCELNDLDHGTHPSNVIQQEGTSYCPLKNPCSSGPCSGKKHCTPDFYKDSYICSDGIWAQWSVWCKCPTTRSRVRICRNPFMDETADDCPGLRTQNGIDVMFDKAPTNCSDALRCGCTKSTVYSFKDLKLFCDQETDGGGWTVIQRRRDGSQDFDLEWKQYKIGFGNLTGEFWLGLDKIHQLTQQRPNILRVDVEDNYFAEYDYFAVSDEAKNYTLSLGNFTAGNASDSLFERGRNQPFTTKDRYNDQQSGNCAVIYKGAWWYKDCHHINPNGLYFNAGVSHSSQSKSYNWKGYYQSAKKLEIKIRPKG